MPPKTTTGIDEAWYAGLDPAWQAVFADQCGVTSPAKLKKLVAVKEIYLDNESEVTSLAPLARLAKLTELNCDAKQVTDLSPLAELPKLASLRITSPIVDFAPLAKLTALTSLELTDTTIADLAPLAKLAKLERLELNDTQVVDLGPIAGLKKVERLELARTGVTDLAAIAGWKKLRDLVVARCPLEAFDVLAKFSGLRSLDVSYTSIASLAPIDRLAGIHILHVAGTKVSFAELLRYRQVRGVKRDALLGLDVYSDFMELEAFLSALATLDSTRDVEPVLTAWINDALISLLRSKTQATRAPALLERWFALDIAPNEHTKEIAGTAVHLIVTQQVEASLERRVIDELIPQATMDRLLAFNLACYHARRGTKPELLRYARIALELGQEAASFRTDQDFAAFRDDAELAALVATNFTPDPYRSPAAWWASLPEDLRAAFWGVDGEGEAAIREMLDGLDQLQLDGVRNLDPLRGLRVKRLINRQCKASSLEIVATMPGLEELIWEKDQYLGGTRLVDLSPLAAATTLRVLKMPGHLFTNVDALASLVELTELEVRGSPIESIEGVRALRKLKALSVDAKTPLDLSPLEGLEALETLWLHGPVVSFEPIAKLRSLTGLWIQRCTLADGSPVPLAPLHGLSKLRQVYVGNDRATAAKKELKSVLPECKVA